MKRIHPLTKFIKRQIKEDGKFGLEQKLLIKAIIEKMENDEYILDKDIFMNISRLINLLRLSESGIFKILHDFDNDNRRVINRTIYLKFYQFLIEKNAYITFMEKVRKNWPEIKTLRQYMCQLRPFINPTVTISASIVYTSKDINYWRRLEENWHKYYTDFIKEEI